MSQSSPSLPRWFAVTALVVLALSLVASLWVQLSSRDVVVGDDALQAVVVHLETQPALGTVVVHPPWRDDVAARLRVQLPRADVRLAPPVKEGRPRSPIALLRVGGSPGPAGYDQLQRQIAARSGPLTLELYSGGGKSGQLSRGRSMLLDDIPSLRVRVERGDEVVECNDYDPTGPRYRCPSLPEWNYVGRRSLVIGGQSRTCLWAHPITGGRLVIEAARPRGVERLKLSYGLADTAAGSPGGQAVTIEVRVGERQLGRFVQENQQGYSAQTVVLEGVPEDARITFVVSTPHDGARHFCFDVSVDQ